MQDTGSAQSPPIRVLIDASFAARQHSFGVKTGVGRVIDEIVCSLTRMHEFSIKAVGMQAHDLNTSQTDLWVERWAEAVLGCRSFACSGYRSFTGLGDRAGRFSYLVENMVSSSRSPASVKIALIKAANRLLRRMLKVDLRPIIDTDHTDVFLITFFPPPPCLPNGIPKVAIIYDIYPIRFPDECKQDVIGNLKSVIAALSPERDIVIAISEFTKKDFCDLTGFPQERVIVCRLAASSRFRPLTDKHRLGEVLARYGIESDSYFLTVANPQPRKNLVAAVNAFATCANRMPDWTGALVLAGNGCLGWGGHEVDRAIDELGSLRTRVVRTGPVAESDLAALYSGATGFLFPSTFEGFGLPVLEAMSCGVPVIASNATSIPEVGGDAPIYCDPFNISAFADGMERLLHDKNLRQLMSEKGLLQSKAFSWDAATASVASALRKAHQIADSRSSCNGI